MASTTAGQQLLEQAREKLRDGEVPASIYSDPAVYELEKERVFGRSWVLVGHTSEIADPGDYVVRPVADQSLIVARGEDGAVRAFENVCQHQGNELCRAESGNTSHFRCSYHGWTYANDGSLIGVPFQDQGFPDMDREEWALDAVRADTYAGLVFANLDPDAPSLEDYLGDLAFYLDFAAGRADMEVRNPQRRVMHFNWKMTVVNAVSDLYHSAVTHRSAAEIGSIDTGSAYGGEEETRAIDPSKGYQVQAGPGGALVRPDSTLRHAPEEVQALYDATLSAEHRRFLDEVGIPGSLVVFPNLTFNNQVGITADGEKVPFTYMRTVRPLGPEKTEVLTWHIVERDAPEAFKDEAYRSAVFCFGSSGTFTQDDDVNWSGVTGGSRPIGPDDGHDISHRMGMDEPALEDWPGPGTGIRTSLSDANGRFFLTRYLDTMLGGPSA